MKNADFHDRLVEAMKGRFDLSICAPLRRPKICRICAISKKATIWPSFCFIAYFARCAVVVACS